MKKLNILLVSVLLTCFLHAQEESNINGLSYGFQLNQFQTDFGFGINVTSPYSFNESLAFRLRGNLMFNQHPKDGETQWSPYSNVSLGIVSGRTKLGNHLAVYGEGGVISLFPSSEFTTEDFIFGGYGMFGFEFLISNHVNYFIELGGVGTGAEADKIPNQPIYSNGFITQVGFRINL